MPSAEPFTFQKRPAIGVDPNDVNARDLDHVAPTARQSLLIGPHPTIRVRQDIFEEQAPFFESWRLPRHPPAATMRGTQKCLCANLKSIPWSRGKPCCFVATPEYVVCVEPRPVVEVNVRSRILCLSGSHVTQRFVA